MRKYLGRGQIAECMRSGIKCFAHELVRDGRNPALLVLPEWADPPHPQERPYSPNNVEGQARFPIAPDPTPNVAPVLTALSEDGSVTLDWTEADGANDLPISPGVSPGHSAWKRSMARIEQYVVYRGTGLDGSLTILDTLPIDFGNGIDDPWVPDLSYEDTTTVDGTTYRYQIKATDCYGRQIASNIVTVEGTPDPPPSEVDGVVQMTSYGVLERRGQDLNTYAPNGTWSSAGVASSGVLFAAGLDMYPIICAEDVSVAIPLIVVVTGTYGLGAQTDTITVLNGTRYKIGTVPFTTITSIQVTQSELTFDGFFSVGAGIRTTASTSGYDAITYAGALEQSLSLSVSGTPKVLEGPLSNPVDSPAVDFAALGMTGTTLFITKLTNTAARTIELQGLPGNETLDLPVGSGTSVAGVATFTSLTGLVVTAGTATSPSAAVGAVYRALSPIP